MIRLSYLAVFVLAASPTLADKAHDRGCAATSAIVADAVALRAKGADQPSALAAVKAKVPDAKYAATVPPLLDWVYTLPKDQLTDEAVTAYKQACLAQLG
ncbi:hypothetical protein [Roseovarius arcticus]|uniref:hypothetical protein n=1 Tax=Roseovarius arcticus TaxID=2547404 RepID=UPI0011105895|nr:hypothetical protein [Roseovarius arcticus]